MVSPSNHGGQGLCTQVFDKLRLTGHVLRALKMIFKRGGPVRFLPSGRGGRGFRDLQIYTGSRNPSLPLCSCHPHPSRGEGTWNDALMLLEM